MKFYIMRQNNSGGSFKPPAIEIYIEAETADEAVDSAKNHITVCGDSGRYADYDDCGCCPCCGHRWPSPDLIGPDSYQLSELREGKIEYWGGPHFAMIDRDGVLTVASSPEDVKSILERVEGSFAKVTK